MSILARWTQSQYPLYLMTNMLFRRQFGTISRIVPCTLHSRSECRSWNRREMVGAKNGWGVLVTTTAKTTLHHCTCWKVSKEKRGGRLPSLKVMMICKQFNQSLECSIWGFHYFMFSSLYSWGDIHDKEEFEGMVSNDKRYMPQLWHDE